MCPRIRQLPAKIQSTDKAENFSERQSLFAKSNRKRKRCRLAQNHLRARPRRIRRRQQKNPPCPAPSSNYTSRNSPARVRNFRRQPRQPNRLPWSHSLSRVLIFCRGGACSALTASWQHPKPTSPPPSPSHKLRQPPSPSPPSPPVPRSAQALSTAQLQSPHSS